MSETTKVDDAFYQLTLAQRDGAWRELDALRIERDTLAAQLTEVTRERDAIQATYDEFCAKFTSKSVMRRQAAMRDPAESAQAALAPLRAVVGEASIVACDACGRELGSAPTIPPCPECIGFKRAKAHALPVDPSAPTPR